MARRSGHQKTIDTVHWTLFQEVFLTLVVGTPRAATAFAAQHLPETVMRTRGEWLTGLSGTVASGVGTTVTAGLILVPEGTGTTVLWSPNSDGDAPWIWWDVMHLMYIEQVTDVVVADQLFGGRRIIDSKAMRKVRNREVQLVVENTTITGLTAQSVNVVATGRQLAGS